MSQKNMEILLDTFIFSSILPKDALNILSEINYEVKTFSNGDSIYSPSHYEKKIGFVLAGECVINKLKSDGSLVPLNVIKPGDSFGILAVLSCKNEYPTQIVASRNSEILFISQNDFFAVIKKHSEVAMNVISFLSEKISFLNSKISTFTSDNVEQKLASYLFSLCSKIEKNEFEFNRKRTAEIINTGRASLYRALDSLSNQKLISYDNKKIYILDPEGLERISK